MAEKGWLWGASLPCGEKEPVPAVFFLPLGVSRAWASGVRARWNCNLNSVEAAWLSLASLSGLQQEREGRVRRGDQALVIGTVYGHGGNESFWLTAGLLREAWVGQQALVAERERIKREQQVLRWPWAVRAYASQVRGP